MTNIILNVIKKFYLPSSQLGFLLYIKFLSLDICTFCQLSLIFLLLIKRII